MLSELVAERSYYYLKMDIEKEEHSKEEHYPHPEPGNEHEPDQPYPELPPPAAGNFVLYRAVLTLSP